MQVQQYKNAINNNFNDQIHDNYKFQDMLIEEREQAINELFQQQLECHELMKNIQFLVDEQGEVIDDIRTAIEASSKDVNDGKQSLVKAEEHQKTNIKLTLYVLLTTTITVITGGLVTWAVT